MHLPLPRDIKILAPVTEIVCNARDNVMFLVCITSNGFGGLVLVDDIK